MGINTVALVEVLYLYLMLASHNGSTDVLVLADKHPWALCRMLHIELREVPYF
jgi:hypothetical protein